MSGRVKRALVAGVVVVVLGAAFLWTLPEIVRRVALDQIPKRTGRAVSIGDVDLNLFTGRLAVTGFRLAERGEPESFVAFDRLDVQLSLLALLRREIRLIEVVLTGPAVRIARTGPAEFNFSDLLTSTQPAAQPQPGPSRWTFTVDRLAVSGGRVLTDDRAVAPPARWTIQGFEVDASRLTTRSGAPAGRLAVRAQIDEARLSLTVDPLRLEPIRVQARLALDGFRVDRLEPYVFAPLGTPYRPRGARLSVDLAAEVDSDAQEVRKVRLAGMLGVDGQALVPVASQTPFLSASRVAVRIEDANLLERTLTVASVEIEGLDVRARRDAHGAVDVVEMFTPRARGQSTAPPAASSATAGGSPSPPDRRHILPIVQALARGFERIRVGRVTLSPSTAAFVDEAVTPPTTLALTRLQLRIDDFTWPVARPASLTLSTGLPGGGTLDVKGPVTAQPFDAELTMAVRDAPVTPYQAYIPVPARLSGRFGGDSRSRVALRDGRLVAVSRGNSWGQNVEIREPGAAQPAIRVDRMELVGIDFEWPIRGMVAKAIFRRPRVEIEREADGTMNVRRLFTPPEAEPKPSPPEPHPASASDEKPGGLLETMQINFGEVRVEGGAIRFLDRTTQPAFSQDLTQLQLTVTDLGNRPGRRARLALQSAVGGDAALDIRGEIGPLGAPASVELVGELRRFPLTSVDPYAATAVGWVVTRGDLQYRFRFTLDGDRLAAENDLVVGRLQVAPASAADEVKRRIGLPLGLVVALIKDRQGNIQASVPVTGSIRDPAFHLGDAIWTAVKNVLVNVVTAPFKAIGRLFSSGERVEEPRVDPVTFAAGSAVLSPAMEDHLLRVADFLRATPFVNLSLTAMPSGADVEALRDEALDARLRSFQKERGLDDAAVLRAYYAEQLSGVPLPATPEDQLARLREREPAPDALLTDLARQRVEATRARLLEAEGIPPTRLSAGDVAPGPATTATGDGGGGRVEFAIRPAE